MFEPKEESLAQLLRRTRRALEAVDSQAAGFMADCLAEEVFHLDRTQRVLQSGQMMPFRRVEEYCKKVEQLLQGEPLQYILGTWEFMGLPFFVGEGVLIPRPETELLVEAALNYLRGKDAPVVWDLCSGSGCIAVSIARFCPQAQVYALEKSPEAFSFLQRNAARYALSNLHLTQGDLFHGYSSAFSPRPDCILSNPPYIESALLGKLQEQVQREPRLALDGGKDGLKFYRVLSQKWLPALGEGGMVIVECGEGQGERIAALFKKQGIDAGVRNDLSGLDRLVLGTKG